LKLLQERIGKTLEHRHGLWLSEQDSNCSGNENKIDKWDFINLKDCTEKEATIRIKRKPAERKKIFASYSSDEKLISRLYKEPWNLKTKRINNPISKWAHELNRQF
jgi:hypothetical protein